MGTPPAIAELLSSISSWFASIWGQPRALVTTLILLAPLFLPIIYFLLSGWKRKHNEIVSYFKGENTIAAYFKQFPPGIDFPSVNARENLDRVYNVRLGRRLYYFPLAL